MVKQKHSRKMFFTVGMARSWSTVMIYAKNEEEIKLYECLLRGQISLHDQTRDASYNVSLSLRTKTKINTTKQMALKNLHI